MDGLLYQCHFKSAESSHVLAQDANRYLDAKAPWKKIKEDRQAAADSLYVALCVISHLKTAFYPFLPFSSQKVHEYLGFEAGRRTTAGNRRCPSPAKSCVSQRPSSPSSTRSWPRQRPAGWDRAAAKWRKERSWS